MKHSVETKLHQSFFAICEEYEKKAKVLEKICMGLLRRSRQTPVRPTAGIHIGMEGQRQNRKMSRDGMEGSWREKGEGWGTD